MKKTFTKDLFVLWLALAALICAGLNLNSSLNKLANKEVE
jgi:type II secretory pathway component PulF